MVGALPLAYASHVHVHEVGTAIVANAPAMQTQRGIPHRRGANSRQPNVDSFRLHVETVASHASVGVAGTQKFVAPRRTVSTDHVNFSVGVVQRCGQVMEQVEQARIEMMNVARTMVTKKMVERIQRSRYVGIAAPVNDVESLAGVCVIEAEPVFASRRHSNFRRSSERRGQQKHGQPQSASPESRFHF